MLFITGCTSDNNYDGTSGGGGQDGGGNSPANDGSTIEEKNADGQYIFRGVVTKINGTRTIEMEIVDSEIAFGIYWVNVGEPTEYVGKDGGKITLNDVKVGDTIEVAFGGQVMQSYPPQISAQKITVIK